ncbi:helix-turn-helix domain-containing protein [Rhizobium tubonense]|uniref:HTH cro/C1-type domain-containing protein n=1 Tax=Rhizobium tubonense TaxID=484088 RepID=A0A2W4C3G7_9HYPH|nr:hypothetical protein CPY51_31220 [Rhizobium tubonense]
MFTRFASSFSMWLILIRMSYLSINSFTHNIRIMRSISFIRTRVFNQTQASFAKLAGVTQGTVSKWEAGTLAPSQAEMVRVRTAAIRLAIPWDDEWFFVVPKWAADAEASA